MSARLAPSSRPLPLLFVAFLSFFVFPWPSPLRVIIIIDNGITRVRPPQPSAEAPIGLIKKDSINKRGAFTLYGKKTIFPQQTKKRERTERCDAQFKLNSNFFVPV